MKPIADSALEISCEYSKFTNNTIAFSVSSGFTLELTKLEYEKREFNNTTFNIVELEKEIVRTSQVMLDEKGVKAATAISAIENSYQQEIFDEFVKNNKRNNRK